MDYNYSDRLIYLGEWFQAEASMARSFYIYFFPSDNTVEIFDHKTKKTFLRRTKIEGISEKDFYIGAKLNIFGRQIDLLEFGDALTRQTASKRQKTFGVILPEGVKKMGKIFAEIKRNNFSVNKCRMVLLTPEEAREFYADKAGDAILPFLIEHITSGPVVGMELVGDDAIEAFKNLVGPDDPIEARGKAPNSLRALFGEDTVHNGVYCPFNRSSIEREIEFFFPTAPNRKPLKTTATLQRCTLCIVKPHAIKDGKLGDIISMIYDCGFNITALKMSNLDRANCEEFYEIYKGVVPEYVQMILQLSNGPCVAMEIVAKDPNTNSYPAFRNLCGPVDPEIARQLRPQTIRARFGINKVLNAVHCTDLEEDGLLEVEYFFKILE